MGDEKDAFYVVRKGDIVGIYTSFTDCQLQASFSPVDPSISVYKGYGLSKEAESYLVSHGLKQASFSTGVSDVQDGLFGALSVCPFQDASESNSSSAKQPVKLENFVEHRASAPTCVGMSPSARQPVKLDNFIEQCAPAPPCVGVSAISKQKVGTGSISLSACRQQNPIALENYVRTPQVVHATQSKGNPGLAGAGAVLQPKNRSEVWRLREGVGIATNNVAEYRSVILGLKTALEIGYKHVHVRGDSLLVVNQIQGKWKIKNENMSKLCKEALELKRQFTSFTIEHVAREFNSEADALANQAVTLRDGEVKREVTGSRA